MVAAIAHLAELDVKDERVRSLCFVCLCGQSSEDLLRQLGLELGQKLGKAALRKVSGKVVGQIQQSVGGRLMTQKQVIKARFICTESFLFWVDWSVVRRTLWRPRPSVTRRETPFWVHSMPTRLYQPPRRKDMSRLGSFPWTALTAMVLSTNTAAFKRR